MKPLSPHKRFYVEKHGASIKNTITRGVKIILGDILTSSTARKLPFYSWDADCDPSGCNQYPLLSQKDGFAAQFHENE